MSAVPTISIDVAEPQDDFDDDCVKPNINECHTDVEELDSDGEKNKGNSLIDSLKKNVKCNGAVTDVEDYEDSGDDDEEEEQKFNNTEFSLNEFLDQGLVDEHSNLQGNVKKTKLQAMHSITKSPSPTAFHLTVLNPDLGATTDVEDCEASGDEIEEETHFSDDDKPIILEGANMVDVHDSMNKQKKTEKYAPRVAVDTSSSDSESEAEKNKMKLKIHHKSRKGQRCEEAKSDVENIFFSDDDNRKKVQKSTPIMDTPDIEVMAFEGSEGEDEKPEKFPEINITFATKQKKIKPKSTPIPSPMLKLPTNNEEALTDVENLNSSDDDDDEGKPSLRPMNFMPIAVVKSDALTDVEDFDDSEGEAMVEEEKVPEITLPSPTREFTVLVENKAGEPYKQTTPLPDNIHLGFVDLDADKGTTDIEDFDDESGEEGDEDENSKIKGIDKLPDLDGGYVESSDHSVVKDSTLRMAATPEPKTDTEDIFMKKQSGSECRQRRRKTKHSKAAGKQTFLDTKFYVDDEASAHTDVEDLHVEDDDVVLKDKNIKLRRATIECSPRKFSNGEVKTDVEILSDDDHVDSRIMSPDNAATIDFQIDACSVTIEKDSVGWKKGESRKLDIPVIRRISATPRPSNVSFTDVEQFQCDSDDEEISYSRAATATPSEVTRHLADICESRVHDANTRTFDMSQEYSEIKGNQDLGEAHTDIEFFD